MHFSKFILFIPFTLFAFPFIYCQDLEITYEVNEDQSVAFYYQKYKPGSYYISLYFTRLENAHQTGFEGVVDSPKGRLCRLRPIDRRKRITFQYKYQYLQGTPNPEIDSSFVYQLPIKPGNKTEVKFGVDLRKMLFNKMNYIPSSGYIFYLTEKDTVCAVRKGIVLDINNDVTNKNSDQLEFTSSINSLIIEHPDGTKAQYSSFKQNSMLVKSGETVYPGSSLGQLAKIDRYDEYKLYLHFFYLTDTLPNTSNLYNRRFLEGKSYKTFRPYFICSKGVIKLKDKMDYHAVFDPKILTKEFTRRERKKYKKKKLVVN